MSKTTSIDKPSKIKSRGAPEPPKKVLSCYFLFREEVFSSVRRDNPEARVTDITRIISEMWNNLDPKEKSHY